MTDAKPIRFDLIPGKEDARARCKEPSWGPATRKVLTADAMQKLRTGECIRPDGPSSHVSWTVIVGKFGTEVSKMSIPDDLRVCIDYVMCNTEEGTMLPQSQGGDRKGGKVEMVLHRRW
jgi:hypothetical protein